MKRIASPHTTLGYTGLVLITTVIGCSQTTDEILTIDRSDNTKEAQITLVAGIEPATFRQRLRRHFDLSDYSESEAVNPPYDFSNHDSTELTSQTAIIAANLADSDWPISAEEGKQRIIYTDLEKGEEWEQEYDTLELEALFSLATQKGINQASRGETSERPENSPGLSPQAWSYGVDTRIAKPLGSSWPINHNILMRMGQVGRSCTGTLVGRRLVLTAAHCVVNRDLSLTTKQYRARNDSTTEPFGLVTTASYWWDAAYDANNCHIKYDQTTREICGRYDWALIRLPDNAWSGSPNGTPGWMGYWVPGESAMEDNSYARNDGYPRCDRIGFPSSCVPHRVYGDMFASTSVLFRGPDTSGVNSIFQVGNDISPGHSGSAIWSNTYPNNTGGPFVLGIVTNELCGTCSGATGTQLSHPTMVRRITPWVGGFITTQRVNYP